MSFQFADAPSSVPHSERVDRPAAQPLEGVFGSFRGPHLKVAADESAARAMEARSLEEATVASPSAAPLSGWRHPAFIFEGAKRVLGVIQAFGARLLQAERSSAPDTEPQTKEYRLGSTVADQIHAAAQIIPTKVAGFTVHVAPDRASHTGAAGELSPALFAARNVEEYLAAHEGRIGVPRGKIFIIEDLGDRPNPDGSAGKKLTAVRDEAGRLLISATHLQSAEGTARVLDKLFARLGKGAVPADAVQPEATGTDAPRDTKPPSAETAPQSVREQPAAPARAEPHRSEPSEPASSKPEAGQKYRAPLQRSSTVGEFDEWSEDPAVAAQLELLDRAQPVRSVKGIPIKATAGPSCRRAAANVALCLEGLDKALRDSIPSVFVVDKLEQGESLPTLTMVRDSRGNLIVSAAEARVTGMLNDDLREFLRHERKIPQKVETQTSAREAAAVAPKPVERDSAGVTPSEPAERRTSRAMRESLERLALGKTVKLKVKDSEGTFVTLGSVTRRPNGVFEFEPSPGCDERLEILNGDTPVPVSRRMELRAGATVRVGNAQFTIPEVGEPVVNLVPALKSALHQHWLREPGAEFTIGTGPDAHFKAAPQQLELTSGSSNWQREVRIEPVAGSGKFRVLSSDAPLFVTESPQQVIRELAHDELVNPGTIIRVGRNGLTFQLPEVIQVPPSQRTRPKAA